MFDHASCILEFRLGLRSYEDGLRYKDNGFLPDDDGFRSDDVGLQSGVVGLYACMRVEELNIVLHHSMDYVIECGV